MLTRLLTWPSGILPRCVIKRPIRIFLLQKKIEARLHEKYPDRWIPAYTQVTFSPNIRYSDALRNARRQESIMQEVMMRPDIDEIWPGEEIEKLILSKL